MSTPSPQEVAEHNRREREELKRERDVFQQAVVMHYKQRSIEVLMHRFKTYKGRYQYAEVQEMWLGWCLAKGLRP